MSFFHTQTLYPLPFWRNGFPLEEGPLVRAGGQQTTDPRKFWFPGEASSREGGGQCFATKPAGSDNGEATTSETMGVEGKMEREIMYPLFWMPEKDFFRPEEEKETAGRWQAWRPGCRRRWWWYLRGRVRKSFVLNEYSQSLLLRLLVAAGDMPL